MLAEPLFQNGWPGLRQPLRVLQRAKPVLACLEQVSARELTQVHTLGPRAQGAFTSLRYLTPVWILPRATRQNLVSSLALRLYS